MHIRIFKRVIDKSRGYTINFGICPRYSENFKLNRYCYNSFSTKSDLKNDEYLLSEELNELVSLYQPQEVEKVKKILSINSASNAEIMKLKIKNTLEKYQRHDTDTGSTEVQVAILSKKIYNVQDHLKNHTKDKNSKRYLNKLLNRRRKLLRYIYNQGKDGVKIYKFLIKEFDINEEELQNYGRLPGRQIYKTVFKK